MTTPTDWECDITPSLSCHTAVKTGGGPVHLDISSFSIVHTSGVNGSQQFAVRSSQNKNKPKKKKCEKIQNLPQRYSVLNIYEE